MERTVVDTEPTNENPLTDQETQAGDVICSNCGEHVRFGVVRCWNCQQFMREDIAEHYQRMISRPRPVIYSNLEDELATETPDPTTSMQQKESNDADADFDIRDDVAFFAEDGDFEDDASPSGAVVASDPEGDEPATEDKADSYTLARPAEAEPADSQTEEAPAADDSPSDEVDHSVATGGEALWEIAKAEQEKPTSKSKSRGRRVKVRPGSILVYCPHGHRIEVQERHRGRVGRCPRCKTQYTVPLSANQAASSKGEDQNENATAQAPEQHFAGLHLHAVDPGKLKLKSGSLAKSFEEVDLCFGSEGMLLLWLNKKGGLFGGGGKVEEARKELFEYLTLEKKLKNAPGDKKHFFDVEELQQLATVYPTAYAHESIFGGVDVLGAGLIAIRIPKRADNQLEFLALTITQFRKFVEQLKQECGLDLKFEDDQIPMTEKTTPSLCHYTDQPIRSLNQVTFYEHDPTCELELVGWKCQACGLTVSEDGRKKENIGGKNAKNIAKAKCPKCNNAFGKNPLYALKKEPEPVKKDAEDNSDE